MRHGRAAAILVSLVAATWATTAPAQPRQPTFRARTVVTELEVHVVDAAGRPVADLTPDDFAVTEDGVPQVLLGVETSGHAAGATAAPATAGATVDAHVPSPEAAVPAGTVLRATNRRDSDTRAWALVVDDLRTPGFLREQMKACLQALVDGLPADDFVALVPTSGDRRAAREFTRDRQIVRQAIQSLRFPREFDGVRAVASMGSVERPGEVVAGSFMPPPRQDLWSADNLLISSIGNAAMMLGRAGAPRGTVLLVSQGMNVALSDDYRRSLTAQGGGTALRRYDEWREVLTRVQRSGVTLHVIDPTGFDERLVRRVTTADRLVGPSARMREYVTADDRRAAARVIADRSGGLFVVARDPSLAARRVLDASSAGYVLRYIPSRDALDDRLRDVRVTVRRPGVTVRARTAYARVSDPTFEALRAEKPLGVAVAAVVPSADLGLEAVTRLTPVGSKARPSVSVTVVDAPGAPLPPRDILEVLAIVVDMKGKTVTKAGGRAEVTATGTTLATPDLALEPLKPGRYQLRVAVRSVALDRTGAVFLDLDIPQRERRPSTFALPPSAFLPSAFGIRHSAFACILPPMKPSTRRQFLGQTAGTVAGVTLAGAVLPTDAAQTARSASRVLGANDRIRLGFIGCGMQFQDLLRRGFFPRRDRQGDIDFVEVCDVWQPRVDNAKTKTGAERAGRDYRALLARPDIDGVVIVVPDHLHYTIARAAVVAGKDVYLEKPMTYTIDEAAKLQDVVQQTGRMLQVGGSGLNSPLHQALHQYVQAGKMGKVVWGFISYNRNTTEGMWDYPMPGIGSEAWPDAPVTSENLDWQAWLGGARKRPFSKERYFRWRKYWDYSGGNATDLLFHRLGALSAIVGFDFPTRVVSAGGIYVQKNRQVPDTYMTTVEYPKAYCFNMVSCMANADSAPITVYGNWGTLQVLPSVRQPGQPAPRGGGRGVITAERTFEKQFKEANDGKTQVEITTETPMEDLVDNWLNSMRSRQAPIYDVAKGYQVTVAIQLGVQSYREGRALGYDPKTRRILTQLPGRPEYPPQES